MTFTDLVGYSLAAIAVVLFIVLIYHGEKYGR